MRIFWKSSLVVVTNVIVEWIKPETPTGVSGSFFYVFSDYIVVDDCHLKPAIISNTQPATIILPKHPALANISNGHSGPNIIAKTM